jgi:hypothetical protein
VSSKLVSGLIIRIYTIFIYLWSNFSAIAVGYYGLFVGSMSPMLCGLFHRYVLFVDLFLHFLYLQCTVFIGGLDCDICVQMWDVVHWILSSYGAWNLRQFWINFNKFFMKIYIQLYWLNFVLLWSNSMW